jgi:hypothetical protein
MKKKLIIAAAAGAVVAAAVPAMALENEFHGMYKFMGYQSNIFNGTTFNKADAASILGKDAHSGFMAEQRARLQYIAKANDNLKLVTHFELDARFGGKAEGYLGTTNNDGGNLDADQLTLETKNIYLDFNCPLTGTNMKVGIQPWADAYQSLFLLADMSGVYATKKFDPATVSLGWFRLDDNTAKLQRDPGHLTTDFIVVDGKFAVNKDIKIGASYYNVQNDTGAAQAGGDNFELLHMVGVNADLTFGPANVKPFAAYQFGDMNTNDKIGGFLVGATTKTKVGPGAVNFSAFYLSGDDNGTGKNKDFKNIAAANAQYFNPANMWLLVRSGQAVNSSSSVLGNDLTVGDRGLIGLFAGYEGTANKVFYSANVGYAMTDKARTAAGVTEDKSLGTEINANVGYKLFDNLSISAAVAYAMLGDGLSDDAVTGNKKIAGFGAVDADNPYLFNVQLSYVF